VNISHTVKLQGAQQYEMSYFTFNLAADDLPEALRVEVTSVQLWRLMEYIVQRELINLQLQAGHMSIEIAAERIEYLRQCLGPLSEKLVPHGI